MIRRLTEKDREKYLELASEFYSSEAVLHTIPVQYMEAAFEEMMRSDAYAMGYAFEREGQVVGYALLAKTFSQEAGGFVLWLEELYIQKAYRGSGIGTAFFRFLEDTKEEVITRLRLEVEEENEKAIALYKAMGFEELEYSQMVKEYPY